MLSVGSLTFATPLALVGFIALTVLWWFMRLKPPPPTRIAFPGVRLLAGLPQNQDSPALTPPWVLILRILLASLLVLGAAHPVWNVGKPLKNEGPVYLIVDNDWSAASEWRTRQEMMINLIDQAGRENRSVVVVKTTPEGGGGTNAPVELLAPQTARHLIETLTPNPWSTDREGTIARLLDADFLISERPGDVVWFSNGLADDDGGLNVPLDELRRIGAVTIIGERADRLPVILRAPVFLDGEMKMSAERISARGSRDLMLRATGDNGGVVMRLPIIFRDRETVAEARIRLPVELYNRIARIDIDGMTSVGSVVLLDERWRRRPVGLLASSGSERDQPLLNPTHYLERALEPFADIRTGRVADLLARPLSVLVLTDTDAVLVNDQSAIGDWMENGGVVLRFADPAITRAATDTDSLLPVRLRSGDRAIGGVMSWGKPAKLAEFTEDSPFYGLTIPDDIEVRRQVLAQPSPDLAGKTWVRLNDGTPLITAERRGKGWLVLIHTTASPDWSNLPISGLFVDMLRRIVGLSQGVMINGEGRPMVPQAVLDGFAKMQSPGATATAISAADFADTDVSARHPPGYYGDGTVRRALNFGIRLDRPVALGDLPAGIERRYYDQGHERDFRPVFLVAAIVLFVIDTLVSLGLRGLMVFRRRTLALSAVIFLVGGAVESRADALSFARENSLDTRLAYVLSGDDQLDEVSRGGLRGLTQILAQRTAAVLGPPQGVNPASDDLSFFPLLYWPIPDDFSYADDLGVEKIRRYMRNGGTVLFDTRTSGVGGDNSLLAMQELARAIRLPRLVPIPKGHVLGRSFYLLKSFPGRWQGGTIWIEHAGERINDGVSPVIVGSQDWAGAWALDDRGRPLYPVVPGGERQRELAYRFGINLVMYTLTGNYKADQVHIQAIMQRLGQ